MTDWLSFFTNTIASLEQPLGVVLRAYGCREGWLQAELFRAGREHGLSVNSFRLSKRQTADLSAPDMIGEIKIVGADYSPKMRHFIEEDVRRLREATAVDTERYMILLIPHSQKTGKLSSYLDSCSFSDTCIDRRFPEFRLRIWRL